MGGDAGPGGTFGAVIAPLGRQAQRDDTIVDSGVDGNQGRQHGAFRGSQTTPIK